MDRFFEVIMTVFVCTTLVIMTAMGWAIVKPGLIEAKALSQMQQILVKELAVRKPIIQNQGNEMEGLRQAVNKLHEDILKLQKPKAE